MKKIKYLFAFALPILAMAAMSSCSEDEASYSPAKDVAGAEVFFHSSNAATVDIATDGASFDVTVSRIDTVAELNVPITLVTDDSLQSMFTVPETVAFAAGEANATVTVGYDAAAIFDKIGYADYKKVVLSIADEANTTPYGITNLEMSVGFPEPWSEWEEFGTGLYTLSGYWAGTHSGLPVYYREYLLNNKDAQFYIPGVANEMNLTIDYDRTTGNCAVKVQKATVSANYGPVFVSDMPNYPLQAGLSYENYPCTFNAETGTFSLTLVYFVSAELGSSANGYFAAGVVETIQLDGYELPDASVTMEYNGVFAGVDGESKAVVNLTMGVDADSVRVAMVEKIDNENLAEVIAGTVEYQKVKESGFVTFPVAATGTYNVIAVSYMGGEAAEFGTLTFDAIVGGGSIYDMLQGGEVSDYEGDWLFENIYNGKVYQAVGNISAVEGEDGATYLLCQGFADAAQLGYTSDEFKLIYDAETGLITLPATQQCANLEYEGAEYPVLLALSNSVESTVFGGDLIGGFVDGKIKFLNVEDNKYQADSFVFYNKDLGLISGFNALEWERYEADAEAPANAKAAGFGKATYVKSAKSFEVRKNLELTKF